MNKRLALQRLWWKELRQLTPLVTMLPVLVVLLLVFQWLNKSDASFLAFRSITVLLCFGMPGLFACGAGALLVGYEKEVRTLGWLASLPITPQRIVRVKFLAALVGLLALWLVALLIFAVASGGSMRLPAEDFAADLAVVTHTLFLLLAGFALAWCFRSALVALLLVVPVASLPFLLAYCIDLWIRPTSGGSVPSTVTLWACQVAGIALAWWLMERFGRRRLAAQATNPTLSARFFATSRAQNSSWHTATPRIHSPVPALLWQFAHQSRAVLLGTSIMLAVAVTIIATTTVPASQQARLPLAVLLAFLATSWLGVTAFQSDTLGNRIRFLSDRGISARATWLTRHAVPVTLLALFGLIFGASGISATTADGQSLDGVALAIGLYLLVAVTVYVYSQWLGQVILSPILATLAAPPVALAAISYGSFAVNTLGTPWWLALLLLPVPAIATLVMMRRWMDRRRGLSYWASHAGFLAAVGLLPAIPLLIAVARQPRMPDTIARELQNEIRETERDHQVETVELVLGDLPQQIRSVATRETQWENSAKGLDQIEAQLQANDRPVSASSAPVIKFLLSTASLARVTLDFAETGAVTEEEPAAPLDLAHKNNLAERQRTEQEVLKYRRAMTLLAQVARRMRRSWRLIDQDTADQIEIWLLTELQGDPTGERIERSLYDQISEMLADRQARKEARMRAVALSWHEFQTKEARNIQASLGGYPLPDLQEDLGTLKGLALAKRRVGMAVGDLWQLARDGSSAATSARFSQIAEFWRVPLARYGIGPMGAFLRADDLDRFLHPPPYRTSIASQWFADWERVAAERLVARDEETTDSP